MDLGVVILLRWLGQKCLQSSEPRRLVNDQSIPIIIHVSDDSESEKLSSGSLGMEASFNESSFKALFLMRMQGMIVQLALRPGYPKLHGL